MKPLPGLQQSRAMSLTEVMIAMTLGSLVLACVASLSVYGARSSTAMLNYTDLDRKSRYASDWISAGMRQATGVSAYGSNSTSKWFVLTNNAERTSISVSYDATARTLTVQNSGEQPFNVLTECDRWDFAFYQRTPFNTGTNLMFYPATNNLGQIDLRVCKLVSLSWKCSRTILAQKVNTESVQAAQIVLRNKM